MTTEDHQLLILGANGFIGSNLIARILREKPHWKIHALDVSASRLPTHPNLTLHTGTMRQSMDWIERTLETCHTMLPLAAIAQPLAYVRDPVHVFEVDFEDNLAMVRLCLKHGKRLIFPSTSEVYGMSPDVPYDEATSNMLLGPIVKERWIYASSKQLLDRLIYAYGTRQNLDFTLFRPFNWFGPGLDSVNTDSRYNRVVPHFLGHLLRREDILLVGGGQQRRCFLHIDDGIEALMRILENKGGCATGQIFNIGHPDNETSIAGLAHTMLRLVSAYPGYEELAQQISITPISAEEYYNAGYQDVQRRIPDVRHAQKQLGWQPKIGLEEGLSRTVAHYIREFTPQKSA